ncbi:heme exporter protein B [Kordiimonas sediminis]|uniref:Heme exporter protein B n=2 Tax=Kordiimonas sediminis TaxID=1735581 RepID=A0A919E321_9PROT|nr:heme exporter protein CcmB [Kordiimonas sediminis]GHF14424.1 heme exporter protein B [Kordiimonas sediminis]
MNASFAIMISVIMRDVRLGWSQGGTGTMSLSFFFIAVTLFPFGVGPEPQVLTRIAPGVIWVVALLACLLSLDRLYQADYEDGSLDDLALSPAGLLPVVIAKILAHWISTSLPLVLLSPLLGLLMNLPAEGYVQLVLSLAIGTLALSFIGSIGAALTVAMRRGGVLLSLLVLPLYIPSLIFGVTGIDAAIMGLDVLPHTALLSAITLVAVVLGPIASASAIRLALE